MPAHSISRVRDFDVNQAIPNESDFDPQHNNSDRFPETTRLADGDLLALWTVPPNADLDPDRARGTGLQRFDPNGDPDGAAILILDAVFTEVTALPDGGFVVANSSQWARFDADGNQVGGYGDVGTVATRGQQISPIDIDTLADGGWVISWTRTEGTHDYDVYAQTFSAAGVAGAITQLNPAPAETETQTSVTALADGGFAVTWVDGDFGDDRTVNLWRAGVVSVIDAVNSMSEGEVVQLADGRLVVTWSMVGSNGPNGDIFAAFVATDGTVSAPFFAGNASFDVTPRVEAFADGRFLIVWAAGGEDFSRVFGQVFEADGTPLDGGRFTVGTIYSTSDFSVTILSDTDFMVAWAPDDPSDHTMNGTLFSILSGQVFPGTPGDDNYVGTPLDDTMYGLGGNDSLNGGAGNDRMEGGPGNDTYYVDSQGDQVVELPGEGRDVVYSSVDYTLGAGQSIEVLSASNHAGTDPLILTGNELGQEIWGNAGANVLRGGGGNDFLIGQGGGDTYFVDTASALVFENAGGGGRDVVYASVDYALLAGQEVEVLSASVHSATTPLSLTGNELGQEIWGNAGANVLRGGGGNDFLIGQGGGDTYFVDTASALVFESAGGGGRDVVYASVSYALLAGQEIEVLSASVHPATTPLDFTGNEFGQEIWGNAGANSLRGGGGNDFLLGQGGNDTYFVDTASALVFENAGGGRDVVYASVNYSLLAGQEVEVLSASNHAATNALNFNGNELAQELWGNAGANTLDGKLGNDSLIGQGGADTFAFTTALGSNNVDFVADFVAGTDRISLDHAIFTGLAPGALPASAFVVGTAAGDADDRIIYNSATGQLYFDADGNGAGAAIQFATLSGHPLIAASDFTVI